MEDLKDSSITRLISPIGKDNPKKKPSPITTKTNELKKEEIDKI